MSHGATLAAAWAPAHAAQIAARLNKARGQLAGIVTMYEDGRPCIDILDQLAASRAALDAVGLIVIQECVDNFAQDAAQREQGDDKADDLVAALRRYVRTR